jgi:hypothetical protein
MNAPRSTSEKEQNAVALEPCERHHITYRVTTKSDLFAERTKAYRRVIAMKKLTIALVLTSIVVICGSSAGAGNTDSSKTKPENAGADAAPSKGTANLPAASQTTHCINAEDVDKAEALAVLLFDDQCDKWCKLVKPMMAELGAKNPGLLVVEIDTSRSVIKEAKDTAKKLKVGNFLAGSADSIPMVGVFRKGRLVGEIVGAKSKDAYANLVQKALAK